MKASFVALSALAATVSAVKPAFQNLSFDVKEGEPFTLKFDGCASGCSILLLTGPDGDSLKPYSTLETNAKGGSATVTLDKAPSGAYAFRIIDNATKEDNYSKLFTYKSSVVASSSPASTTPASTSGSSSTGSSSSTPTNSASTTPSSSATETTSKPTTTKAPTSSKTTSSTPSATTSVPASGNSVRFSPIALIAGAVAAMVFIS